MSIGTRNPLRFAGANLNPNNVNTGELPTIRGGQQAFTVYSGINFLSGLAAGVPTGIGTAGGGFDFVAVSGAGRLNSYMIANSFLSGNTLASGAQVTFYDSAVATSGGPFPASGHKIIGVLGVVPSVSSGGLGISPGLAIGVPANIDWPFQSGLCIANKSGVPTFSVSWTPESNAPTSGGVQN